MLMGDNLYTLDLDVLLDAVGLWADGNSSSVTSAVRYLEEERSYADSVIMTLQDDDLTSETVPGEPRPPENPPRDDDCGER